MVEGHIFGKAFFYFVCMDVMLYSGEGGLQLFEAGAVTLVLVWHGSSQGGARRPLDGEVGSGGSSWKVKGPERPGQRSMGPEGPAGQEPSVKVSDPHTLGDRG